MWTLTTLVAESNTVVFAEKTIADIVVVAADGAWVYSLNHSETMTYVAAYSKSAVSLGTGSDLREFDCSFVDWVTGYICHGWMSVYRLDQVGSLCSWAASGGKLVTWPMKTPMDFGSRLFDNSCSDWRLLLVDKLMCLFRLGDLVLIAYGAAAFQYSE